MNHREKYLKFSSAFSTGNTDTNEKVQHADVIRALKLIYSGRDLEIYVAAVCVCRGI